MLDSLKSFFQSLVALWRNELNTRWRIGVVVGLLSGTILAAAMMASSFAQNGCAIYGWKTLMINGFGGIFMSTMFAVAIGIYLVLVMYIPEGLRRMSKSIREEFEYRRKLREEGVPRDWSRMKWHLCFWPMILALCAGLSITFSYIIWALVC